MTSFNFGTPSQNFFSQCKCPQMSFASAAEVSAEEVSAAEMSAAEVSAAEGRSWRKFFREGQ